MMNNKKDIYICVCVRKNNIEGRLVTVILVAFLTEAAVIEEDFLVLLNQVGLLLDFFLLDLGDGFEGMVFELFDDIVFLVQVNFSY